MQWLQGSPTDHLLIENQERQKRERQSEQGLCIAQPRRLLPDQPGKE
jgi:hypothetical protein